MASSLLTEVSPQASSLSCFLIVYSHIIISSFSVKAKVSLGIRAYSLVPMKQADTTGSSFPLSAWTSVDCVLRPPDEVHRERKGRDLFTHVI